MPSLYPNTLSATNDMYTSYSDAYTVTPSATNDLPNGPSRALLVAGAGTLVVNMASQLGVASPVSITLTIPASAIGFILPLRVSRVLSGAATLITALY